MSDTSSNTVPPQGTSKGRLRARIKARSSRLISLLGFRNSDTSGPSQPSGPEAEDKKWLLIKTRLKPKVHLRSHGTGEDSTSDSPPHKKQRRPSSPQGLAARLTTKMTLGNPTVIRRTNLRSRPSVRGISFREASAMAGSKQEDNTDSSFTPSLSPSAGTPPVTTQSTPPTSNSPARTSRGTKASSKDKEEQPFPLDQREAVEATTRDTPSIQTVEVVSCTKIFFEIYHNNLSVNGDARAQRQQQLEQYITTMNISSYEKARTWKNWTAQEQSSLRRYRVLMARSMRKHDLKISEAGFKPIRILGQGSFGVVLLVHEGPSCPRASSYDRSSRLIKGCDREGSSCESNKEHRRCMVGRKKEVYAMKVIRKSVMIRNCQEAHVRAERDFLAAASGNSRWIVPLVSSFQDAHLLYLVMDYMVGGDFLGLLIRRSILPESVAKHYIAEMVLCIEETHRLGWIHRDVKPDNFLISESGHLKISDFGLSFDGHWAHNQAYYKDHRYDLVERLGIQVNGDTKDQEEARNRQTTAEKAGDPDSSSPTSSEGILDWQDRTHRQRLARSIVGTSQYMAPEVVRGDYYDGRCDYWSLGVILYECLYGRTPFASKDRAETKWKIHNHTKTLHFPSRTASDKLVSIEAVDLINRLLQEKEHRLSCGQYRVNDIISKAKGKTSLSLHNTSGLHVYTNDASDITSHPFFDGIRWDTLSHTSPPFIPKVKGWDDTRYFDDARPFEEGKIAESQSEASSNDDRPPEKDQKRLSRERARDKILRDPELGKIAFELRRGAFAGYEYRRSEAVEMAFVPERGREYLPHHGL